MNESDAISFDAAPSQQIADEVFEIEDLADLDLDAPSVNCSSCSSCTSSCSII
jgi:hypothetical protein